MRPRTHTRRHWLLLTAALLLGYAALHQSGLLDRLEAQSYDWRLAMARAETRMDEQVAVILIDDASLEALEGVAGRWPWPRAIYAELMEFLALAPPRLLVFDVMFSERQGPGGLGAELHPDDRALVEATAQAPFPVVHAARFLADTPDERNRHLLNRPLPKAVQRFDPAQRYGGDQPDYYPRLALPGNNNHYLPFPELLQATPLLGVVDVAPDSDGVYRRLRLLHRYQDTLLPGLATVPWLEQTRPRWLAVTDDALDHPGGRIPLDGNGHYLIHYYRQVPSYSFAGLMAALQRIRAGELEDLPVSPFEFEDRIVFLGASAAGLEDLKNTPIDARLPGVYLHATVTANLLRGDHLLALPRWSGLLAGLILIPLLILAVALARHPFQRLLTPLILGGGYLALDLALFQSGRVLPLVPPLTAVALATLAAFAYLMLTEGRDKLRFKRMMSQYLSPAVLEQVVARHSDFAQAEVGSRETLTILFSDIRGFTSLSERLPPERVVELLNHYFSAMTEAIFERQGTIDKFIGDAIMAFWGAPLRIEDHADQALLAALDMNERLIAVNAWLAQRDHPPIAIGIGLHSGEVVLGNIGSRHKLDYTIIGDNVNLASRMEGLTKHYQAPILLTEATRDALQRPFPCRVVDLVRVKGKTRPIRIYQPLGDPERLPRERLIQLQEQALAWDAFMDDYLARRWDRAQAILDGLPDDPLKALYQARLREFQAHEPAPDWDGVVTMQSK